MFTFDQLLGLTGLVGTLGFGILSVILWQKTYKPKVISWAFSSEAIVVANTNGGLLISFEGALLENIFFSRVAIWNSGKSPVPGSDIASKDPLAFKYAGGGEILSRQILRESSAALGCKISEQPGKILLNFDWLTPNHGLILEIVHTEPFAEAPSLSGTVMNVDQILRADPIISSTEITTGRRITIGAFLFVFLYLLIIAALFSVAVTKSAPGFHFLLYGFIALSVFVGIVSGIVFAISGWAGSIPEYLLTAFYSNSIIRGTMQN